MHGRMRFYDDVMEGYIEYKIEESPFWRFWNENIKPFLEFMNNINTDLKIDNFRDPPEIVIEGVERGEGFAGVARFFREVTEDIGFLVLFLIFVLMGSLFFSEKAMFYLLVLLLLGMIVVNTDKIRRALAWLQR